MSVWDNQYYEDEESAPDSLGPCSAHGRMNCLECYDLDIDDTPDEDE